MGRPNTESESTSVRSSRARRVALAGAIVLLGSSVFLRSSSIGLDVFGLAGSALLAGAGLVLLALLWSSGDAVDADRSARDEADDGDSSVWNAIPPWQYEGRHAESGGLARGEQERALQEIQREAEELSDDSSELEPDPDESNRYR